MKYAIGLGNFDDNYLKERDGVVRYRFYVSEIDKNKCILKSPSSDLPVKFFPSKEKARRWIDFIWEECNSDVNEEWNRKFKIYSVDGDLYRPSSVTARFLWDNRFYFEVVKID